MKTYDITTRVEVYTINELCAEDRKLIEAAQQATNNSYVPYSNFRVGAALRMADGSIITGSNQENAAYPSGLCAERTAIFYAQHKHPEMPIISIAIAARNKQGYLPDPIPPCGACRQVMLEVEDRYKQPIRVLLCGAEEIHVLPSIAALLPFQFVGSSMG